MSSFITNPDTQRQNPDAQRQDKDRWRSDAYATIRLATPLALTQLAYMAIVTTDVVMMGWLGQGSLAAGTLGAQFYGVFYFTACGVMFAVAPIFSQYLGARRFRMIRPTLRSGLWVGVILAIPCLVAIWWAGTFLIYLGQNPVLAMDAQAYVRVMSIGLVTGLWNMVIWEFLASHNRPRATLVVTVVAIGVNALIDYALMFGNFGFPQMGLVGAGVASALVSIGMFLTLTTFILRDRHFRRYRLWGRLWKIEWPHAREIFRVGTPLAISELSEIGIFMVLTLLLGLLGTSALAAQAIAGQCWAIVIMIPIGVSQAAAVRVGRAVGARDHAGMVRAGWVAVYVAVTIALIPASVFWFFGDHVIGLFVDTANPENAELVQLAVAFLAMAALVQIADSAQITIRGALQGLKDTRGPMLINLMGYWAVGLPLAWYVGVYLDMGGRAMWAAMAFSIIVVAGLLIRRFRTQIRRLPDLSG